MTFDRSVEILDVVMSQLKWFQSNRANVIFDLLHNMRTFDQKSYVPSFDPAPGLHPGCLGVLWNISGLLTLSVTSWMIYILPAFQTAPLLPFIRRS